MEIPRWAGRAAAAVVVAGALIIRRALQDAAAQSEAASDSGYDWSQNEMNWHWRCECGAQSRGGDIKADTEYNAQRHQWRKWSKGTGHPMPEVYQKPL